MRQFAVTLSRMRAVGHRLDMLDQSASGHVRRVGLDAKEPRCEAGMVRRYLHNGEEIEQLLAEISAINAELLARRELS